MHFRPSHDRVVVRRIATVHQALRKGVLGRWISRSFSRSMCPVRWTGTNSAFNARVLSRRSVLRASDMEKGPFGPSSVRPQ
jgi:hypothetical protein